MTQLATLARIIINAIKELLPIIAGYQSGKAIAKARETERQRAQVKRAAYALARPKRPRAELLRRMRRGQL